MSYASVGSISWCQSRRAHHIVAFLCTAEMRRLRWAHVHEHLGEAAIRQPRLYSRTARWSEKGKTLASVRTGYPDVEGLYESTMAIPLAIPLGIPRGK
jgi:hypothetical protein